MPRGIHNLGRKQSEAQKRRVREGIARAIAEGRPFGSPRKHPIYHSVCEMCATPFRWTVGSAKGMTHQKTGRFCSKRCLVRWLHKYRQLLPHADEIKRLYWDEGLSLWEIARKFGVTDQSAVKKAMQKAGLPRRPKKHIGKTVCVVGGCGKPAHKIQHKGNGAWYGKRCKAHWLEHRASLQKKYVVAKPEQRAKRIEYSRNYYQRTREQRLAYSKEYREKQKANGNDRLQMAARQAAA